MYTTVTGDNNTYSYFPLSFRKLFSDSGEVHSCCLLLEEHPYDGFWLPDEYCLCFGKNLFVWQTISMFHSIDFIFIFS